MLNKLGYVSLTLFLALGVLFATVIVEQGITVYSAIDYDNIGIDEQVTLRYTIAGAGFFQHPDLPEIKDFSVILTSQHTSIDFSSGKPIPYTVFEYMFMPHRKGELIIPKIFVRYKGYYYSSEEYTIKVGDKLRKVYKGEPSIPFKKFVGKTDTSPIFIQSTISSADVFYNQQIIYTYTIYTRVPIKKIPDIKIPEYEAFHREPLYYKKEYMTEIADIPYRAFEYKFALFPFMTDTHTIPSIKMILRRSNFPKSVLSELYDYFGDNDYFIKRSESFKINVTELPLKDKPLSFSGLIGNFEILAAVEAKEVAVNDFVVLTVKVRGSGNIRSIPHIKCPIMDNLREYNSDVFMNFDKKEPKISGEKIFQFALMPFEKGKAEIPSIGFSYFDEDASTYLTKWTEPIEINITREEKKDTKASEDKLKKGADLSMFYLSGGILSILGIIAFVLSKLK
jgi:hypothetical protein